MKKYVLPASVWRGVLSFFVYIITKAGAPVKNALEGTYITAADHTVCFTWHRPKSIFPSRPYDESKRRDYQAIVDRIAEFIQTMVDNRYTRFITGGAQGFDQLAFWAVHKITKETVGIRNIVYIPFDGQERR